MKKPNPQDTHQIIAIPKLGQPRQMTVLFGTEEECQARMEHIREQDVRNWKYRIEPIPGKGPEDVADKPHDHRKAPQPDS